MKELNTLFKRYRSLKENENSLIHNAPPDATLLEKEDNVIGTQNGHTILSKEFLEKYSPDNIDINLFWKKAVKTFKYYPIIRDKEIKSIEHLNEISIKFHYGYLKYIEAYASMYNVNPLILEIGPGYGSVKNYIKDKYGLKNYYAIDVNPLFRYKKLYKCNGKSIPDKIPNGLDIVYSVNVFQHLSNNQRTSYYKQASEKLKPGGLFIFSMFAFDESTLELSYEDLNNETVKLFGTRDEEGNVYASFFNQFTQINDINEICIQLLEYGLVARPIRDAPNHCGFICVKAK